MIEDEGSIVRDLRVYTKGYIREYSKECVKIGECSEET